MKHHVNRRDFIKYNLAGALGLSAWSMGLSTTETQAAAVPDIAVATGKPREAVIAAVNLLGGIGQFVKKGNKVVIKPNMSFPTPPERASNTHPEVIQALAELCKQAGASRVSILDNPLAPSELCLENSGIAAACAPVDRDMVRTVTNPSLYREVDIPQGKSLKRTDIMKEVLEADVLIAAPVAKSHSGGGVSLSMKGMMGLIYNRMILHRRDLSAGIVDISTVMKADLSVIDATRVLTTGGPGGPGKVITPNTVIASRDMVAADAYTVNAFEWYGKKYLPRQVAHIRQAHERGLGRMDIKNMIIKSVAA